MIKKNGEKNDDHIICAICTMVKAILHHRKPFILKVKVLNCAQNYFFFTNNVVELFLHNNHNTQLIKLSKFSQNKFIN